MRKNLNDFILCSILEEYRQTYKSYLELNDYLTPSADCIRMNLWMLRAEYYKRKCKVLEGVLG